MGDVLSATVGKEEELAPGDYHAFRVVSNLCFVLEKLDRLRESESVFQELLLKIQHMPQRFMVEDYHEAMSPEEERYL